MEKQEQFGQRMMDILNGGALTLAMALGYKHRIFDVMDDLDAPAAPGEIADAAGLSERYLREWLGSMAMGRIVEISTGEAGEPLYHLPKEHAAMLTRRAGDANLGVYAQEMPLLTSCAMEAVSNGFVTGEGVPFSQYPDFQAFMGEISDARHQKLLVDQFVPFVDDGRLLKRLKEGIRVCDLGCGEGVAMNLLAEAFPNSRFLGIDNHELAIAKANADAATLGLSNAEYCVADAAALKDDPGYENRFDYVMAFDAIHDQTRPHEALESVVAILAKGGIFSMVDIAAATDPAGNMDHPLGPFLYTVSLMHCMPVGLNCKGAGLGMMWGREKAVAMLEKAGFEKVDAQSMAHDPYHLHFLCRA
ncbi:MAG: class I SAM-dependent methyltransferase [Desulfobacteraceae bacterium]|nr:class I SAM-dependent methyltransferase [Desulfobacteraceae bacterium]